MPLILAADGHPPLYLSGTLLRNRRTYYDALNSIQLRAQWASCARRSWRRPTAQLLWPGTCRHWFTELARDYRRDAVARHLPPLLVGRTVVTVRQVAELLNVSNRAAQTGVDHLVALGVLAPRDERRWGRIFHATEVIDRLGQPPAAR